MCVLTAAHQGFSLHGDRLRINFGYGGQNRNESRRRPLDEDEMRLAPVPEAAPPADKDVAHVIEELAKFVHKVCAVFVFVFDLVGANVRSARFVV